MNAFPIPPLVLTSTRLSLIPLLMISPKEILEFHMKNKSYLKSYQPTPPVDYYTEAFWQRKIWESREDWHKGQALRFVIKNKEDLKSAVIGTINFNQLFYGPLRNCFLGYAIDENEQKQGLMTEALSLAIHYVFDEFQLHRIQANYMPHNLASARVLEKLGFKKEGLAKKYLFINGQWEDHILTAKISDHSFS